MGNNDLMILARLLINLKKEKGIKLKYRDSIIIVQQIVDDLLSK